ncbi:MAG: peptidase domain-containing ABC transporter [Dysgonamonadaceae bacterium]|jgi:ATP-binding cassette subfamily B protein|nr:peptidase domain-containing ABC transporter [Dysgonamonadaceae bacterium]
MNYPAYLQRDSRDCGPTCVRMVAKYYGKSYSLNYLKKISNLTRSGISLLNISDTAEKIGLQTCGIKLTKEQLTEISLPCIVSWNKNHFIVIYKISNNQVICGDPLQGILKYSMADFLNCWYSIEDNIKGKMGIVLLLEPLPQFYENKEVNESKKLNLPYLLKYVRPHWKKLATVLFALLLGSCLNLIFPYLSKSIIDIGVEGKNINFIVLMLLAQLAVTLGQAVNDLIKNRIMLHTTISVNLSLVSDFLGKLMRLPIAFFDSKRIGDLIQRIGDFTRIQNFLTSVLISLIMAIVTLLVYGIFIIKYNYLIFLVFILGSILYVSWIFLFLKKREKIDYMRFQESAANQSNIIQLITGMQEIKINNCEKQKQGEWEQIQKRLYDISLRGLTLAQTQSAGGIFIDQVKNVIISFLAASEVVNGSISLGMMFAIQYIIGQMNAPVSQFVSFIQSTQDTKISLERLNEIQEIEDEEPEFAEKIVEIPTNVGIRLTDVTFHYNGIRSPKVLDNINLTIPSNKITAIVGMSGSGKTTLLKLILGFYPPNVGEIFVGNLNLEELSESGWRRNCGVVMQEGFIFSDTITKNIAVSDDNFEIQKVLNAAKLANLEDFVSSLPMGYEHQIGMEGNGISSGQKQRILIARAIYKNPHYIFLDEATSALDAENEKKIHDNLQKFFNGKTVLIIAHRLSTVKNADKIIVLKEGQIVEQGTHTQLVEKRGEYFNLVKNQLELGK